VSADRTVEVGAPAKINLFLRVLGRRPDGYHDLETLILPVTLADRLRLHAHADPSYRTLSLELSLRGDPELIRGIPVDETNLALRAAEALARRCGVRGFAEIELEKLVPHAAGLGGGSADAAAVLRALDALWGCGLSAGDLMELGAEVGSDVPALLADGPVAVTGRGERVEPASVASYRWALLTPPVWVSTAQAFRWWDEDGPPHGPDPTELVEAAASGDPRAVAPLLFNDLQSPVAARHPEIDRARRAFLGAGALAAVMSGSGPTVAGLFDDGATIDVAGAVEVRSAGRTPAPG
jgi:4-diphosphocytidyl-2-C-methyl-D-erythritol kinase